MVCHPISNVGQIGKTCSHSVMYPGVKVTHVCLYAVGLVNIYLAVESVSRIV